MTLPTSGEMTAAMINVEMGLAWNAPFSIGSAWCRELANKPYGQIQFSDFYGKTGSVQVPASDLVTGYQPGDAWVPSRYGYWISARASIDGSYPAIGSLTPDVIAYSGGVMRTDEISWYPQTGTLYFYALAGQQHNGIIELLNMTGDVLATFDLTGATWYQDARWVYTGLRVANPFSVVPGNFKIRFSSQPTSSLLVAGSHTPGGSYQDMYGFGTQRQGFAYSFGSMTPAQVYYPGGSMICRDFLWNEAGAGYFNCSVVAGQERSGTFFIRDSGGNIIRQISNGTWYPDGAGWSVYSATPFSNPFTPGHSYYVSMDQ
jgi:hypothetical protein